MGDGEKRKRGDDETEHGDTKRCKKSEKKETKLKLKNYKSKEIIEKEDEPQTDNDDDGANDAYGPTNTRVDDDDDTDERVDDRDPVDNDDGENDSSDDDGDGGDVRSNSPHSAANRDDDDDDDVGDDDSDGGGGGDDDDDDDDDVASNSQSDNERPPTPSMSSSASQSTTLASQDPPQPPTSNDHDGSVVQYTDADGQLQLRQIHCANVSNDARNATDSIGATGTINAVDAINAPPIIPGARISSCAPPPVPGLEDRQADIAARRLEHQKEGTNAPNFISMIIFSR